MGKPNSAVGDKARGHLGWGGIQEVFSPTSCSQQGKYRLQSTSYGALSSQRLKIFRDRDAASSLSTAQCPVVPREIFLFDPVRTSSLPISFSSGPPAPSTHLHKSLDPPPVRVMVMKPICLRLSSLARCSQPLTTLVALYCVPSMLSRSPLWVGGWWKPGADVSGVV